MNDWRINFAKNLKYLRQIHGLTQVEMAKIVAVCVSTYRRMEKADLKVRIHAGRVCRICDHFGISTDEMMATLLAEEDK